MLSERKLRLNAERLRELLHYAPETGRFYWRVSKGGVAAGTEAGSPHSRGYTVIRIEGPIITPIGSPGSMFTASTQRNKSITGMGIVRIIASRICASPRLRRMPATGPGAIVKARSRACNKRDANGEHE